MQILSSHSSANANANTSNFTQMQMQMQILLKSISNSFQMLSNASRAVKKAKNGEMCSIIVTLYLLLLLLTAHSFINMWDTFIFTVSQHQVAYINVTVIK